MDQEEEKSGVCVSDNNKELLNAFEYHNLTKFKNILSAENINLNKTYGDPHYGTIINIACREKGNLKYVKELLKFGADPNHIDKIRKQASIHYATLAGDEEIVQELLTNDATDVNIKDRTGSTALHLAVKHKQMKIVLILLENPKVDINVINRKGNTPLHEALKEDDIEYVKLFIKQSNIDLEIKDFSDQTLRELICEKYPQLEKNLPEVILEKENLTADQMFSILRRHDTDAFVKLLKKNRDVLEENDGFHTFMQYCCDFGIQSVVQELLDLGVSPNTTSPSNRKTPIMIAASKGFCSIVSMLVNHPKTSYEAVNNETALHSIIKGSSEGRGLAEFEIEKNHIKCLRILLNQVPRNKLNINQRDNRGNTALHYAAKQGEHEMVILLLNAGSYIGIRNKNNEPSCSDISYNTFETFLDNCIYTNDILPREDQYEIIFNYKCLYPYSKNEKGSNSSIQNINDIEQDSKMYNCESEPLLYMTQNRELRPLLKHPIFTSFLHLKWHKIRTYFYINLILYLMFCFLFTGYILFTYSNITSTMDPITNKTEIQYPTYGGSGSLWALVTLFLILLISRELFQFILSPKKYVLNPENWLEIGVIGIGIAILFCKNCVSIRHQISAIGILLSWAELVLLIGRHPALSTNIEMFKTVSWNFLKFLAWYSILIIAFALSFHSLFRDVQEEDNLFEHPGVSVFKTVVMLTGEFDTGSIPFIQFPVTSHLLFVLFVFLIAIVLFNLLNGLAVSDTQAIKSDAELVSYISRVKLISYIERTLYNPSACLRLTTKVKSLCCCISNAVNNKRKEMFSNRINLFNETSCDCEIRILPNLNNRAEINRSKYASKRKPHDFENGNCIDFTTVYMEIDIVKAAKQVLIKKQIEQDIEKANKITLEKERKLNQMLIECKETLEQNKEMLEKITSIMYKLTSTE